MRARGSIAVVVGLLAIMCPSALARPPERRLTCLRRPGHTLRRAGAVRIYRHDGQRYGCVRGSRRTVAIDGRINQLAGVSALLSHVTEDDQYAYIADADVVDFRTGRRYGVWSEDEPLGGPWTLTPGLVLTVVLGADGDAARLYETPAPTGAPSSPSPTTETLDLVGHGRRVLAAGAPRSIDPSSVRFVGATLTWTQDGVAHSSPD